MEGGATAIKGYPTFPKAPALLEPHHQIVLCYIQETCWGSLSFLQMQSVYLIITADLANRDVAHLNDIVEKEISFSGK